MYSVLRSVLIVKEGVIRFSYGQRMNQYVNPRFYEITYTSYFCVINWLWFLYVLLIMNIFNWDVEIWF